MAKGLLLYRGLGTGVPRALNAWPKITFCDDRHGLLFVAKVQRAVVPALHSACRAGQGLDKSSEKNFGQSSEKSS